MMLDTKTRIMRGYIGFLKTYIYQLGFRLFKFVSISDTLYIPEEPIQEEYQIYGVLGLSGVEYSAFTLILSNRFILLDYLF